MAPQSSSPPPKTLSPSSETAGTPEDMRTSKGQFATSTATSQEEADHRSEAPPPPSVNSDLIAPKETRRPTPPERPQQQSCDSEKACAQYPAIPRFRTTPRSRFSNPAIQSKPCAPVQIIPPSIIFTPSLLLKACALNFRSIPHDICGIPGEIEGWGAAL